MIFCHLQEYDYVIQIDEAINEVQFAEAVLHQPLECGWSIAEPKRHAVTFKEPQIVDGKGGILFRCLLHFNLPKPQF